MKLAQFGKNLIMPAVSLLVIFVGGGSVVTVATTTTFLSTGTDTSLEMRAGGASLADFCTEHWGELAVHGHYCRFEQWFHLNLKHAGQDPVFTAIAILPGDTIRVEASSVPQAWIGGVPYDASEEKITVSSAGYLTFRAPEGQGIFAVEKLGLERCFAVDNGQIDTIACPTTL